MTDEAAGIDPTQISPEEFAGLIAGASDEQIEEGIHTAGTQAALERIFENFPDRFQPDKAKGVDADIQWVVTDQGEEHPFFLTVKDGTCTAGPGRTDSPKVTLTVPVVPFTKLVTGQANGMQMFMTGKLKISGDLMFAPRIMTFFEPPTAG